MKAHPIAVVFGFVGAALAFHSTFDGLLGVDGFYHLAQARRMLELGLAPDQTWMSHGALVGRWVDHHWGFHLLLLPFAGLGTVGGKVAASVYGGLSLGGLYLWLRSRRVPMAALWAVTPIALSWSFLFRVLTVRAMCISTGFVVAALHLALRGPAWGLFLLSLGWSLSYQMAVLAVPIAIGAWAVPRLMKREGPGVGVAVAGPLGWIVGLLVHPQREHALGFFLTHAAVGAGDRASHGTEWQSPLPSEFWMHGGVLLVLVLVLVFVAIRRRPRLEPETVLLLLGAAAGTVLTLRSMRFVEFGAPLLAMAGGLVWRDLGVSIERRVVGFVAVVLAAGLLLNVSLARSARHPSPDRVAGAAAWLEANVPADTRVHNIQWAWWPEWTFYGPQYRWTLGFDPNLLATHDPEAWKHFQGIRTGYYEDAGPAIKGAFGAEWAVLGLPDPAAEQLLNDATLEVVFLDAGAAVLRVR